MYKKSFYTKTMNYHLKNIMFTCQFLMSYQIPYIIFKLIRQSNFEQEGLYNLNNRNNRIQDKGAIIIGENFAHLPLSL